LITAPTRKRRPRRNPEWPFAVDNIWFIAAIWIGLALVASLISIRVGISVALIRIPCETRRGHPAKMIVKFADEGGCDLIVIGHSDHSELWGRLLGDTADRISDHAHCSVLIVKQ